MSTAHDKSQLDLGLTGKNEKAEKKLSCTFLVWVIKKRYFIHIGCLFVLLFFSQGTSKTME